MTRQSIRDRYPFHAVPPSRVIARPVKPYNRHSIRHRTLAMIARINRILNF